MVYVHIAILVAGMFCFLSCFFVHSLIDKIFGILAWTSKIVGLAWWRWSDLDGLNLCRSLQLKKV